jgi:flagella basal body P-ring formation protein FlgA
MKRFLSERCRDLASGAGGRLILAKRQRCGAPPGPDREILPGGRGTAASPAQFKFAQVLLLAILCLLTVPGLAAQPGGRTLPVPRVTIYPGNIIRAEMLADRVFTPAANPRYPVYEDTGPLTGAMAVRTLLPGQAIPVEAVRAPYTVTPGKSVPVVFRSGGLNITGLAVVLQSGSPGDTVSARNADSGIVIKATVQADGTLAVNEP